MKHSHREMCLAQSVILPSVRGLVQASGTGNQCHTAAVTRQDFTRQAGQAVTRQTVTRPRASRLLSSTPLLLQQPPHPLSPPVRQISSSSVAADGQGHAIKRFLRQKGLNFSESHPCLAVSLPVTILGASHSGNWADMEAALATVYLNR